MLCSKLSKTAPSCAQSCTILRNFLSSNICTTFFYLFARPSVIYASAPPILTYAGSASAFWGQLAKLVKWMSPVHALLLLTDSPGWEHGQALFVFFPPWFLFLHQASWASLGWCQVKFPACPVWFALRLSEALKLTHGNILRQQNFQNISQLCSNNITLFCIQNNNNIRTI